jgi:hypothetical protein
MRHPIIAYMNDVSMGTLEPTSVKENESIAVTPPDVVSEPDATIVSSTETIAANEETNMMKAIENTDSTETPNEEQSNNSDNAGEQHVSNEGDNSASMVEYAKHAIVRNDVNQLRMYIDEHPSLLRASVDELDDGMTLLHYAVQYYNANECVQLIIERNPQLLYVTTYGVVNEETGAVEVPPQTAFDIAWEHYEDENHPILLTLKQAMGIASGDEVDDENAEDEGENNEEEGTMDDKEECEIDVNTGECRFDDNEHNPTTADEEDVLSQPIPNSDDMLEEALREFEEMKRG